MNELQETRLFALLSEASTKTNSEELQSAYNAFAEQMKSVADATDHAAIFRALSAARIELEALELHSLYEQGEKCAYGNLPTKITCLY